MSNEVACQAVVPRMRDRGWRHPDTQRLVPVTGSLDFTRDDSALAPSHLEAFAKIKLPADRIVDEEIFSSFALHAPVVNQIRAVHDGKSLAHVVVGDHDGQPRFAKVNDDLLDVVNRDG